MAAAAAPARAWPCPGGSCRRRPPANHHQRLSLREAERQLTVPGCRRQTSRRCLRTQRSAARRQRALSPVHSPPQHRSVGGTTSMIASLHTRFAKATQVQARCNSARLPARAHSDIAPPRFDSPSPLSNSVGLKNGCVLRDSRGVPAKRAAGNALLLPLPFEREREREL